MGGFGSGRHGGKTCTEDMRSIDVRKLQRDGALSPGTSFNATWTRNGQTTAHISMRTGADHVTLSYRQRQHDEEWKDMENPVRLVWTPCNYGGRRAWFLCPAVGCGRRVAVLHGGRVFACRHCHRLAYKSQRETDDARATRKADKVRERLGWEAGILNGEGGKPKGMHWRTYWRLHIEHDRALVTVLVQFEAMFGRMRAIDSKAADSMDRWG